MKLWAVFVSIIGIIVIFVFFHLLKRQNYTNFDDEKLIKDREFCGNYGSAVFQFLYLQMMNRYDHPNETSVYLMKDPQALGYIWGVHQYMLERFGYRIPAQTKEKTGDRLLVINTSYCVLFGDEYGNRMFRTFWSLGKDDDFIYGKICAVNDVRRALDMAIPAEWLKEYLNGIAETVNL